MATIPGLYHTGLGEQRAVELADHSHVVLDARTRLRVRFTADARIVELLDGQAQSSPSPRIRGGRSRWTLAPRPLLRWATVFEVAYIDREVHVAMVEGKVAVAQPRGDAWSCGRRSQSPRA